MSLAKELNDANTITENSQPADVENELMTVIGEVLPLLIEGKINVNEASDIIIGKFDTNKTEEQIEISRQTIAEILSQITNQTIKLGEFDTMRDTPAFENKNKQPTEFINLIKELISKNISPEDVDTIEVAVNASIDITPLIITQKIDIKEVVHVIHDETNYDIEVINALVVFVIDCISTYVSDPTKMSATAMEFLKQLRGNVAEDVHENKKTGITFFNSTINDSEKPIKSKHSAKKVSLSSSPKSIKSADEPSTSNQH